MRSVRKPLLTLCLMLAAACSAGTTPIIDPGAPASIAFELDTFSILQGETANLPVKVLDASNRELAVQPTLTVEGTGSAPLSILSDNRLRGEHAGLAVLRASAGQATASLPVLVFGHPSGTSTQTKPLSLRPYGVAVGKDFAYVTQLDGQSVTRFSLAPFAASATVAVGSVPTGISVSGNGKTALVSNQHDPSVGIVDATTNVQTDVLPASSNTFRTIFNVSGTRGYATLSQGRLLVIDMQNKTVIGNLAIVGGPNGVALAPNGQLLYISSTSGGISVVNTQTNAVVRTISLPGSLQDIAISRDGTELYAAREDAGIIEVLALPNGNKTASIMVPASVFGMSLTPDGKQLWAAHTHDGAISIIDRADRAVINSIFVGGSPRRIAFDRLGSLAVVSNESGGVHLVR